MVDEAQQGLKDRNLQDYYESMLSMFGEKGWKYLTEDLKKLFDAANSLDGIETMEQLHFRRGQIDVIRKIVAQPAIVQNAYDLMLADEPQDEGFRD